jgi:uncharacterized protein YaaN involved in tellurite resistance
MQAAIAEIEQLGAPELRGTAATTTSILERDSRVVGRLASGNGPVTLALAEMRRLVGTLTPGEIRDGTGADRETSRYAARVASAEADLERASATLDEALDAINHENAVLAQQERALWLQMRALRGYARLAQRLDESLTGAIDDVAVSDQARARRLRVDVLHPVRHRRQELLTHLAVAAQGYAAIRIVEATNADLVRTLQGAVASSTAAVRASGLALRAMRTARQLGDPVTATTIRDAMAGAMAALTAVGQSRSEVLAAMRGSLDALHADVEALTGPSKRD